VIVVGAADLKGRIEKAVTRLVSGSVDGDRARIALPILYPSGAGAAVEVVVHGETCFISDMALGFSEAEMQGASDFYPGCAKRSVERFGVGFDGMSVFVLRASVDRMEGAIAAVANASVNATTAALFRAVEEKEKKKNSELFERVLQVFGERFVSKQEEVRGREVAWPAHNVVNLLNGRRAVFEYVNDNANSISSKFLMFSDLSKVEGFSLNSVVKDVGTVGPKTRMLADVSNIIAFSSSDEEYRTFARAA
jgi:hypothetical protein